MMIKFIQDLRSPLVQFLVIQAIIFVSVGVLAWLSGFDFSMALTMAGAVIFILRFVGRSNRIKTNEPSSPLAFLMTPAAIGLFPMTAGILLAFI